VEYFQRVGVSGIIRLNRRVYERLRFTDHGLSHYDLYFPDGSCPPERIVKRFLEIVEGTSGALAVHCKVSCFLVMEIIILKYSTVLSSWVSILFVETCDWLVRSVGHHQGCY
jgi:hypothetical protein